MRWRRQRRHGRSGRVLDEIRQGLESLSGVNGRLQRLPGRQGGAVIHDAYNANPASLAAALDTVGAGPGECWLVLGDMYELGPAAADLHARIWPGRARVRFRADSTRLGEHSRAAVAAFGAGATHFAEVEALITALSGALQQGGEPPTVLVKGSRGMRMERVVAALTVATAGGYAEC